MFVFVVTLASLLTLSASQAIAQDATPPPRAAPAAPADDAGEREKRPSFRIGGEAKIGIRHSGRRRMAHPDQLSLRASCCRAKTASTMRTPSKGASFEIQNVALIGEGALTDGVDAKIQRPLLRSLQPQPDLLRRSRVHPRGLDTHRPRVRQARTDQRDDRLSAGRPGAALLEAAHPPSRKLRAVDQRRRPLRESADSTRRHVRHARLLARVDRQRQSAVHPRRERAGGRQRHARTRAEQQGAIGVRIRLRDSLRREGARPQSERQIRVGLRRRLRSVTRHVGARRARLGVRPRSRGRGHLRGTYYEGDLGIFATTRRSGRRSAATTRSNAA